MTATSLYEAVGGVSFPFPAASVDSTKLTLEPLDGLAAVISALLSSAINAELGAAWTKVTNSLGTAHPLYGTSPVQGTLVGHQPEAAIVQELMCAFPLLAVHRMGKATWGELSGVRRQRIQHWGVEYIIGMLDVAAAWKVGNIRSAIPAIVDLVLDRRRHPSYASNAIQFGDYCSRIELIDDEPVQAPFAEGEKTKFYGTLMSLKTIEISGHVTGDTDEETWEGARLDVNLYNENESASPINDFVSGDTNPSYVPPTP